MKIHAVVDKYRLEELHGCTCNAILVSGRDLLAIETLRARNAQAASPDTSIAASVRWRNAGTPRNSLLHREKVFNNNDDEVHVWELKSAVKILQNAKSVVKDDIPATVFKCGLVQLLHVMFIFFACCCLKSN